MAIAVELTAEEASKLSIGGWRNAFPLSTESGYFVTHSYLYRKQNLHTLFRTFEFAIVAFDNRILGVSFDGGQNVITDDYFSLYDLRQEIAKHKGSPCTVYLQALDQLNKDGKSLIHVAVAQNNCAMITHLVAAGADINVKDIFDEAPISDAFWTAQDSGDYRIAEFIMDLGCNELIRSGKQLHFLDLPGVPQRLLDRVRRDGPE